MQNITIKLHAQHLRRRLEGRVPAELLSRITDEELVKKYDEHHQTKLRWIAESKTATAFRD
jgi:hypothetical protein